MVRMCSRDADATAGGGAGDGSYGGLAKLRGLPYSTTYDDIRRFFAGLPIKPDGITLCENREGRASGEAYVEFEDEASAQEATKKDRQNLGSRYVEVYKVAKNDLNSYLHNKAQQRGGAFGMGASALMAGGSDFFIKIRGLPFTAREQDVVAFFAKASVAPTGVSLVYNARDQPNGECYVELSSADEVSRALMLHRDSIGHRYVELFRSTRMEAMQALGMPQATPGMQGFMNSMQQAFGMAQAGLTMGGYGGYGGYGGDAAAYGAYGAMPVPGVGMAGMPGGRQGAGAVATSGTVKIRGLPYRVTPMEIAEFFQGFSYHPETIKLGTGALGS
jgi:hypothetical protein